MHQISTISPSNIASIAGAPEETSTALLVGLLVIGEVAADSACSKTPLAAGVAGIEDIDPWPTACRK